MLITISNVDISSDELIRKAIKRYQKLFNKHIVECSIIRYNDKKPVLEPNVFNFNISHSGDIKLVAVSDSEVGIDIEKHKDIDYKLIVKRFFNPGEKCESLKEFYRYWTAKESYTKWVEGDIIKILGTVVPPKDIQYLNLFDGYTVAVASEDKDIMLNFI